MPACIPRWKNRSRSTTRSSRKKAQKTQKRNQGTGSRQERQGRKEETCLENFASLALFARNPFSLVPNLLIGNESVRETPFRQRCGDVSFVFEKSLMGKIAGAWESVLSYTVCEAGASKTSAFPIRRLGTRRARLLPFSAFIPLWDSAPSSWGYLCSDCARFLVSWFPDSLLPFPEFLSSRLVLLF